MFKVMTWAVLLTASSLAAVAAVAGGAPETAGGDLPAVFARAAAGQPLKMVAIGGSITQDGGGWIGDWLRGTFPNATVAVYNAGMSGTGSALALFRLERDVLAFQPDLVLYEFVVNDGGGAPEAIIRTVESSIRRLKSAPSAPAVVMLEMASRTRPAGNIPPQRRVAEHYGLLTVDLNAAVHEELKRSGRPWETFFNDDVHPAAAGHRFYGETIAEALRPYLKVAAPAATALPPVLSSRPLWLDGTLAPLPLAEGWTKDHAVAGWWNRFFLGAVATKTPAKVLSVPFRGTGVGLFYALDQDYGLFYASIDGNPPAEIRCNTRKGFASTMLADNLTPQAHLLQIVVPRGGAGGSGVKLGYLLVAGRTEASGALAKQKTPEVALDELCFAAVRAEQWAWAGPYGELRDRWYGADKKDELAPLDRPFPPEAALELEGLRALPAGDPWRKVAGAAGIIDLGALSKHHDRGVNYLATVLTSPLKQPVQAQLIVDYYARLWLNGKEVLRVDQARGGPGKPLELTLPLEAGENLLLLKVQSGSMGNLAGLNFTGKFAPIRCESPAR
jgi:lysophospholipase L1-like esterase